MSATAIRVMPADDRESGPNWRPNTSVNVGQAERWASMFGGAALIVAGMLKGRLSGLAVAGLGGGLLYRGLTGHCSVYQSLGVDTAGSETDKGLHIVRAFTINKPVEELYTFWRNFENLPRFMQHLDTVQKLDAEGTRTRWVARAPLGQQVEWDAEIINEIPNELIAWQSTEDAQIPNAGTVRFRPAPEGRGTEVKVTLNYLPPAGIVGATVAKLFGEEPSLQVEDDLRRFKRLMETGEIATTKGQPHG